MAPLNGRILDNTHYLVGDYVQYTCNTGFVIMGEPLAICQDNGTWSSPPPTCEYLITDCRIYCHFNHTCLSSPLLLGFQSSLIYFHVLWLNFFSVAQKDIAIHLLIAFYGNRYELLSKYIYLVMNSVMKKIHQKVEQNSGNILGIFYNWLIRFLC